MLHKKQHDDGKNKNGTIAPSSPCVYSTGNQRPCLQNSKAVIYGFRTGVIILVVSNSTSSLSLHTQRIIIQFLARNNFIFLINLTSFLPFPISAIILTFVCHTYLFVSNHTNKLFYFHFIPTISPIKYTLICFENIHAPYSLKRCS